jgi:hypothetical protein
MLYPRLPWPRVAAIGCSFALHTGIALVMTLGPFSYAMMALVLSRLPPEALEAVARRAPLRFRRRLPRLRARLVRTLSLYLWRRDKARPPRRRLPVGKLRETALAFVLLVSAVELTNANAAIRFKLPQPEWVLDLVLYPRMIQRWSMFAPDAPRDDGYGVIDGVTVDGRHIDPFTGEPPDFDRLEAGPISGTLESVDYLYTLHFKDNERYRSELARYVTAEWHKQEGRSPDDRIVEFSYYWVSRKSPPRGSIVPGPTERELVMEYRARRQP